MTTAVRPPFSPPPIPSPSRLTQLVPHRSAGHPAARTDHVPSRRHRCYPLGFDPHQPDPAPLRARPLPGGGLPRSPSRTRIARRPQRSSRRTDSSMGTRRRPRAEIRRRTAFRCAKGQPCPPRRPDRVPLVGLLARPVLAQVHLERDFARRRSLGRPAALETEKGT